MIRSMDWVLLDGLSAADRSDLVRQARRRKFSRREVIFHEGDPGESVHLLEKGHVSISVTTPLGETALLRVVSPGGFFGELALLSAAPRSASASAIEGAETLSLRRDTFDDVRRRSLAVQDALAETLAWEVRRLAAALSDALYLPADKRLWRRVAELASIYADAAGASTIPLTQEEIAQLSGTTRATANRLLQLGVDDGALSLGRGRLTINSQEWVARRAR
jgi:CRP-like cAMP-binding protein